VGSFGASQEHRLPLLVLLFSNGGYLSQKRDVSNYYPNGAAAHAGKVIGTPIAPAPDYAKLAEAYGGYGEKVEKPADVKPAIERGLKAVHEGRLALIEVTLAPI
jgi:acetolactate synthase-1/2/3 large subunit